MKYFKLFSILAVTVFIATQSSISQEAISDQPQKESSESDVSSKELKVFAKIFKNVQSKNKAAQQRMAKVIQDEGITIERYQKLAKEKQNPNSEVTASEEEKKKMKLIEQSFVEIQNEFKSKITKMIKEEGMTIQRYQEVYQLVRQDKSLQEELGELMQG